MRFDEVTEALDSVRFEDDDGEHGYNLLVAKVGQLAETEILLDGNEELSERQKKAARRDALSAIVLALFEYCDQEGIDVQQHMEQFGTEVFSDVRELNDSYGLMNNLLYGVDDADTNGHIEVCVRAISDIADEWDIDIERAIDERIEMIQSRINEYEAVEEGTDSLDTGMGFQ